MTDVEAYLVSAIAGFERDPADSDFQRGYQAALEEMLRVVRDEKRGPRRGCAILDELETRPAVASRVREQTMGRRVRRSPTGAGEERTGWKWRNAAFGSKRTKAERRSQGPSSCFLTSWLSSTLSRRTWPTRLACLFGASRQKQRRLVERSWAAKTDETYSFS